MPWFLISDLECHMQRHISKQAVCVKTKITTGTVGNFDNMNKLLDVDVKTGDVTRC